MRYGVWPPAGDADAGDGRLVCAPCRRRFASEATLAAHLAGRKHRPAAPARGPSPAGPPPPSRAAADARAADAAREARAGRRNRAAELLFRAAGDYEAAAAYGPARAAFAAVERLQARPPAAGDDAPAALRRWKLLRACAAAQMRLAPDARSRVDAARALLRLVGAADLWPSDDGREHGLKVEEEEEEEEEEDSAAGLLRRLARAERGADEARRAAGAAAAELWARADFSEAFEVVAAGVGHADAAWRVLLAGAAACAHAEARAAATEALAVALMRAGRPRQCAGALAALRRAAAAAGDDARADALGYDAVALATRHRDDALLATLCLDAREPVEVLARLARCFGGDGGGPRVDEAAYHRWAEDPAFARAWLRLRQDAALFPGVDELVPDDEIPVVSRC